MFLFINFIWFCERNVKMYIYHACSLQIHCKFARGLWRNKIDRQSSSKSLANLREKCFLANLWGLFNFLRKYLANLRAGIFLANLQEICMSFIFSCNSVAKLSQVCMENFLSQIFLATCVFSCSEELLISWSIF